jgi:hypothetical protein
LSSGSDQRRAEAGEQDQEHRPLERDLADRGAASVGLDAIGGREGRDPHRHPAAEPAGDHAGQSVGDEDGGEASERPGLEAPGGERSSVCVAALMGRAWLRPAPV